MKKKFLDYATSLIKEKYPETDDIKLAEYRYSLEGFYLTISKMLFIIPMSIILNVFKEMIILLLFFNINYIIYFLFNIKNLNKKIYILKYKYINFLY